MKDISIGPQTGLPQLVDSYRGLLEMQCSEREGSPPPKLLLAQLSQESRGNPHAVSPTGPVGLFQFTSATWSSYDHDAHDRKDIWWNCYWAVAMMTDLCAWAERHSISGEHVYRFALAAFNQGQGNLWRGMQAAGAAGADPLDWGNIPTGLIGILPNDRIAEVTIYVNRIMEDWKRREAAD